MPRAFRDHLLQLQRGLCETFRAALPGYAPDGSAFARAYVAEYDAEFQQVLRRRRVPRLIGEEALLDELARRDLVLLADYHTLRQSQRAHLALIRGLVARRAQVVVGLELFREIHQDVVDRYLEGKITRAETLLARINYAQTWGFDWNNYRPLVDYCRAEGLPVAALNSHPTARGGEHPLARRDEHAARIIAGELRRRPDALLVVVFGDFHLAQAHLPARVLALAQAAGRTLRLATVYQNVEELYWHYAATGRLERPGTVRLDERRFVLFNSTPIAKVQSYLLWESNLLRLRDQLAHGFTRMEGMPDQIDHVVCEVYDTLRAAFGVRAPAFDAALAFGADRRFLAGLRGARQWRALLERSKGCYVPPKSTIYLADLNLDVISEMVTQYLRDVLAGRRAARAGDQPARPPSHPADRFALRALAWAAGWLGSKLLNPQREPYRPERLREVLQSFHTGADKAPPFAWLADGAWGYFEFERLVEGARTARAQSPAALNRFLLRLGGNRFFRGDEAAREATARLVGYQLGEALWRALRAAASARQQAGHRRTARDLLGRPYYRRREARRVLFDLWDRYLPVEAPPHSAARRP